jgi:protein O-GlcNAc transferase
MSDQQRHWGLTTDEALQYAANSISTGNLVLAEIVCRSILDRHPRHPAALCLIGEIAARLGLWPIAMHHFKSAIALDPRFRPAPAPAISPSAEQPSRPRFLLTRSWGFGFWADVNQVLGAMLLAEMTARIPVTFWGRNSLFSDGGIEDSFRLYFEPPSPHAVGALLQLNISSIFPDKWNATNLLIDENSKWKGEYSRMTGLYFLNRNEDLVVTDFNVGVIDLMPWLPDTHPMALRTVDEIYRYIANKYLRPLPHIMSEVDDFWRKYIGGKPTIAVHVRGSDKVTEVEGLENINQRYFGVIDTSAANLQILLLTDDERIVRIFKERYGQRIVLPESQRSSNEVGIHHKPTVDRVRLGVEVVRDAYLATRCTRFIGNGNSTVSAMIAILREWREEECILLTPSLLHVRNIDEHVMQVP